MVSSRILIVEDDPNDELLMMRSFKKINLANQIDIVRDGEEALAYLFATGPFSNRDPRILPQVVLLDLKLPKVDGLEVLERIRENELTKTLPVVILTSSDEQEDRLRSYNLGANSYVRKPVDINRFSDAVKELGVYWLELNEPPGA